MKPVCIDLCCGLGGWTDEFLEAGYRVIGFDIVRFPSYRGEPVLQDIRTIDGHRLRGVDVIVASAPCGDFSRHMLPWTRRSAAEPDLSIVKAAFRIADEAKPRVFILENVREAQRWLGPAVCHRGPYYLWGTVPLLSRMSFRPKGSIQGQRPDLRARIPKLLAEQVAQACILSLPPEVR